MAKSTDIKMAVKPVEWRHHDYVNRVAWIKIPEDEVCGLHWWLVKYKGQTFAEMWIGKSCVWGLLYTVRKDGSATGRIIQDRSIRDVEMAIVGALFHPKV